DRPILSRNLWYRVYCTAFCIDLRSGERSASRPALFLWPAHRKGERRWEVDGATGWRPTKRRGVRGRCCTIHPSCAKGGETGCMGFQHWNGQSVDAARFLERNGEDVS